MIANAKTLPKRYYGLHMVEGVAEYQDPGENGGQPYRILINEKTIKQMDPSFEGRPVYVRHVDQVNLANLQEEADGYVVKSFFNASDGKHWVEFMVVSDRGHEAISKGWKLSNSYVPQAFGPGGRWHNVEYLKEVCRGIYNHLAIVDNPRYEESVILTPEEFKAYNEQKVQELKQLSNSKEKRSMFNFFKKTPVENGAELEGASVTLRSGTEKTIKQLINEAEIAEMQEKKKNDDVDMDMMNKKKKNEEEIGEHNLVGKKPETDTSKAPGLAGIKKDNTEEAAGKTQMEDCYANGEHKVKVGKEEMTVNELVARHMKMRNGEDGMIDESGIEKEEAKEEIKENTEVEGEEKPKMKNSKGGERFEALKNAHLAVQDDVAPVDLSVDKVRRGVERYGSK